MSQNTMVIYLKNPKIKTWLAQKAKKNTQKSGSLKSVSSLVVDILEQKYNQEHLQNPLLKYHGLGKNITDNEWSEIQQSMDQFRSSFNLNLDKKV